MPAMNLSSTIISVDDYLVSEQTAELRHEYINGQIYAMTSASRQHGIIVSNLIAALRPLVRGRGCQLFASDMKVRLQIASQDIFYYPDLLLSCAANDREPYYCTQPCVIVEVLSPSTERLDRREKFLSYITLPSLQDYVLVSQTEHAIWHHRRSREWHVECVIDGSLTLDCLGIGLPLSLIYEELDA